MVGTTDVAHEGDPGEARCSEEEKTYLLAAYNRYFAGPRPATPTDVVFTWSGVRALHDDADARPSRISRSPELSSVANGTGGFVSLYGGKLTTHRAMAEEVLEALHRLGAAMSGAWTKDVPLYGGTLTKPELLAVPIRGPASIARRDAPPSGAHLWRQDRDAVRAHRHHSGSGRGDRSRRDARRARPCARDRRRHDG